MKRLTFIATALLINLLAIAQPVITSFTPLSGPVGTAVTISGSGFSATPAQDIVYFGAVRGNVSAATATSLTVTVPAGATYQPITVTTGNLTGYSTLLFDVTFGGGGVSLNSTAFKPGQRLTTGAYPHCVLVADFNGDGKPDLFVAKGSSSSDAVFTNASSGGVITFSAETDLAGLGPDHQGAAVGDLDGDGKPDIVVTNGVGDTSVSVYRNTSSGGVISFAARQRFSAVNGPYAVAIGDLDGDGKPDLAIANNGGSQISIYKNISTPGNIAFAARVDINTGTNPYGIAIGDMDGDGKADLVVTTEGTSSALSVLLNTTSGGVMSFGAPVNYATLNGSFIVAIGDLDGDGKPDLAAVDGSQPNSVTVLRNTTGSPGNLSFGTPQSFATGSYPDCITLSDVDGDGKPDMVTADRFGNTISVLRNTGSAGTIAFDANKDYAVGAGPLYVAVGDLDGDGRPDIVSANSSDTAVTILQNQIGANSAPMIDSFVPASGISGTVVKIRGVNFTGTTAVSFGGVAAASFTVDSATGITAVVGPGASGKVGVTNGNGTDTLGTFTFNGPIITGFTPAVGVSGTVVRIIGVNFTGATAVSFGGVAAMSFTVDSATGITAVVGSGATGSVTVTTPNGPATLAGFSYGPPVVTSFAPASGPVTTTVTINGNNFATSAGGNIVFFGAVRAVVTSATPTQLQVTVPVGATYQPISVTTTGGLTGYSSMPFVVTFANDSPTLTSQSFSASGSLATGAYPTGVIMADFNGDGKPDLATANSSSNTLTIWSNNSRPDTMTFSSRVDLPTGPDPDMIAAGDLDGDGKPDLVVVNFNSGNTSTVSVYGNTSSGGAISFGSKVDYASGSGTTSVALADINMDGRPDLIVTSGNSGTFSIFINTTVTPGAITFGPRIDYNDFNHGQQVVAADLDGDGRPDLVIADFSAGKIEVYQNLSTAGYLLPGPEMDFPVGQYPSFVSVADMDGDGKPDIAVANQSSETVTLYHNYSTPGSISLGGRADMNWIASTLSFTDLNGDGLVDLALGAGIPGNMSVMQNTYSGGSYFSFGNPLYYLLAQYATSTAVGDIDGDGKPDIATTNVLSNTIAILRNGPASVTMASPVILTASPMTAHKGAMVTITGSGFTGVTGLTFGGVPADSFSVVSSTQIDAVVSGGASGIITVTGPWGDASLAGFSWIPSISKGGTISLCPGDSVVLSSSAASGNQWLKNGIAITGDTAVSLVVDSEGVYGVQTTANGFTTSADTLILVSVRIVNPPVITRQGDLLMSSDNTGNQWSFNGTAIAGDTLPTLQPAKTGDYTVTATVGGCVSQPSAVYTWSASDSGSTVTSWPNPVTSQVTVTWQPTLPAVLTLAISDLQGRIIKVVANVQSGVTIDVAGLGPGMYFIKVYSDSPYKVYKTEKISKLQ
jgi:hypothetical protein